MEALCLFHPILIYLKQNNALLSFLLREQNTALPLFKLISHFYIHAARASRRLIDRLVVVGWLRMEKILIN
jgi:hypothetical protein